MYRLRPTCYGFQVSRLGEKRCALCYQTKSSNDYLDGLFHSILQRAQSTLATKQDFTNSTFTVQKDYASEDDGEQVGMKENDRDFPQKFNVSAHRLESNENADDDGHRKSFTNQEIIDSVMNVAADLVYDTLTNRNTSQEPDFESADKSKTVQTRIILQRNRSEELKQIAHDVLFNSMEKVLTGAKFGISTSSEAKNAAKSKRAFSSIPYRDNPAITTTALAHSLWSAVLRPTVDSAIDATCGNGHDSVAIAKMLFQPTEHREDSLLQNIESQLLCIDIQQQACDNTTKALANQLDSHMMKNHVQVIRMSHASLFRPGNSSSIGLVAYNLGWLPNSPKDFITQVESTVSSLVDAFLLVRVDGMVSVMTYPKTNPTEDVAVRAFFECMALLSSSMQTWEDYLDHMECDECCEKDTVVKELIRGAVQQVVNRGTPSQTWRVSEHRKLGFIKAPILLTAMRIK